MQAIFQVRLYNMSGKGRYLGARVDYIYIFCFLFFKTMTHIKVAQLMVQIDLSSVKSFFFLK